MKVHNEYQLISVTQTLTITAQYLYFLNSKQQNHYMKTFKLYFLIFIISPFFWGCEGDPGPVGPVGPQGDSAPLALEYEVEFDLNSNNEWSYTYYFPTNDEIYSTDMVLVYMLWDVVDDQDVWRMMPVNYFENNGMLEVNYDFTQSDVRIFAQASFPLTNDTKPFDDFVARIVVIPAEMSANQRIGNIDLTNYEEVKKTYNLKDFKRVKGTSFQDRLKK